MSVTISGDGTITGLSAGGLPDGTVTAADLASTLDLTGKTVTLPAGVGGKVLQVVQTVKTDTFSTTSGSFVDVTGLSASITPSSASSKILVLAHVVGNGLGASNHLVCRLLRGSTLVYAGDAAGSRAQAFFTAITADANSAETGVAVLLDSPNTTSSTTYKIQALTNGGTAYVNRTSSDTDSLVRIRSASSVLLMEIAA
jgi:hypothetical protein